MQWPLRMGLLILLVFIGHSTKAQISDENKSFWGLGYERNQFLYKGGSGFYAYIDAAVSKNLSFQYTLGAGIADQSGYYAHVPLPIATSFVVSSVYGDFGYLSLLLCLIPEGVSYTVNRTNRMDLRVLVNPLGIYFWKSHIEWKDPVIPQAGAMLVIKSNGGTPMIKLNASFIYQVSTEAPGMNFSGAICIPIK
jgi:hypothetical protein